MSGHRNRLDIRVGIKIDLISVMGSNLTFFWCGVEIDLVLASGSNLTDSFLCGGRFCVRAEKYLFFNLWIETGFIFSVEIEIDLVSVRAENNLF